MRFLPCLVLCFTFCFLLPCLVDGRLLSVTLVSRHGTRAPNPPVSGLCPADLKNIHRYESLRISLAGLTGQGMKELYELGQHAREVYIENMHPGFLADYFDNSQVYFRAVGEDRTIQSAVAMSQSMYPAGTAARGYLTTVPSPVPIYTMPNKLDHLLEVRKAGCKHRLKIDVNKWDQVYGTKLFAREAKSIREIEQICRTNFTESVPLSGENLGDAIKDITDAWTFDYISGFPFIEGLTEEKLLHYRTFAVEQLIGRILGTDEQITYLNGQLPEVMLSNLQNNLVGRGLKFYAYHGHREMLYAVGKFFEIDFNIKFPALPKGAIPPGTSIFFELHDMTDLNKPNYNSQSRIRKEVEEEEKRERAEAETETATTSSGDKSSSHEASHKKHEKHAHRHHHHTSKKPRKHSDDDADSEVLMELDTSPEGLLRGLSNQQHEKEMSFRRTSNLFEVPSSTMNLNSNATSTSNYVIRAYVWHPCYNGEGDRLEHLETTEAVNHEKITDAEKKISCPSRQVKMNFCSAIDCPFQEFVAHIKNRIQRTGTWETLCGVAVKPDIAAADKDAIIENVNSLANSKIEVNNENNQAKLEAAPVATSTEALTISTSLSAAETSSAIAVGAASTPTPVNQKNENNPTTNTVVPTVDNNEPSSRSAVAWLLFLTLLGPACYGVHVLFQQYKRNSDGIDREQYTELA